MRFLYLRLTPHFVYSSLCSKTQAIQAQFVTALAAVLGTSVGLLARRSEVLEELLLAFTAGGFLYLAAVNMLPTVVRAPSSATQTVLEVMFFALGVGMMVLVTFME
jgi:zinc transporter 7